MVETVIRSRADLNREIKKTFLSTLFVTDDNEAHRFEVEIVRDDAPVPLSGATVSAYFIRYSDNATIQLGGSISGNTATVTLKKACYSRNTQFALVVKLTKGSEVSTVFYGEGTVFIGNTNTQPGEDSGADSGIGIPIGDANQMLYYNESGTLCLLTLGAGLAIVNGVLTLTSAAVTAAICGQAVCGETICGG